MNTLKKKPFLFTKRYLKKKVKMDSEKIFIVINNYKCIPTEKSFYLKTLALIEFCSFLHVFNFVTLITYTTRYN